MNYFYLTCLLLLSLCSCVSRQKYEEIVAENKRLNQIVQTSIRLNKIKSSSVEIKSIEFSLKMCEVKLRKQDIKLLECLSMKGSCQ